MYFAAIADAGSIRGAASRLNLSVPVLSEALSELEEELGVSLATRTTRRFELTHAGESTQIVAQRILDAASGLTELASEAQTLVGTLSVTVPVELAGFWLPNKIKEFRMRHPKVLFRIDVTDEVVDLRASKTEIAIRTVYVAPGGECRSAINLPLVVVANRSATIMEDGKVDMPLIDSNPDRRLVATPRNGEKVLPLSFIQTDQITNRSAGLQLARSGFGATMVMKGSVAADLENGKLVELLPEHDFGSIDLKCRFRDRLPSQTALTFVREIGLGM